MALILVCLGAHLTRPRVMGEGGRTSSNRLGTDVCDGNPTQFFFRKFSGMYYGWYLSESEKSENFVQSGI